MDVLIFSNSDVFNTIFSIYVHVTILTAPLFAAFGLFGK